MVEVPPIAPAREPGHSRRPPDTIKKKPLSSRVAGKRLLRSGASDRLIFLSFPVRDRARQWEEAMTTTTLSRTVALAFGALTLWPAAALAQAWPSKTIRMVVPFPAGGGVDYIGRIVGKSLSDRLGQQVVVDNRPGASGIIALEALKASAPDGYTIAAASAGPLAINPHIFAQLPYDRLREIT